MTGVWALMLHVLAVHFCTGEILQSGHLLTDLDAKAECPPVDCSELKSKLREGRLTSDSKVVFGNGDSFTVNIEMLLKNHLNCETNSPFINKILGNYCYYCKCTENCDNTSEKYPGILFEDPSILESAQDEDEDNWSSSVTPLKDVKPKYDSEPNTWGSKYVATTQRAVEDKTSNEIPPAVQNALNYPFRSTEVPSSTEKIFNDESVAPTFEHSSTTFIRNYTNKVVPLPTPEYVPISTLQSNLDTTGSTIETDESTIQLKTAINNHILTTTPKTFVFTFDIPSIFMSHVEPIKNEEINTENTKKSDIFDDGENDSNIEITDSVTQSTKNTDKNPTPFNNDPSQIIVHPVSPEGTNTQLPNMNDEMMDTEPSTESAVAADEIIKVQPTDTKKVIDNPTISKLLPVIDELTTEDPQLTEIEQKKPKPTTDPLVTEVSATTENPLITEGPTTRRPVIILNEEMGNIEGSQPWMEGVTPFLQNDEPIVTTACSKWSDITVDFPTSPVSNCKNLRSKLIRNVSSIPDLTNFGLNWINSNINSNDLLRMKEICEICINVEPILPNMFCHSRIFPYLTLEMCHAGVMLKCKQGAPIFEECASRNTTYYDIDSGNCVSRKPNHVILNGPFRDYIYSLDKDD